MKLWYIYTMNTLFKNLKIFDFVVFCLLGFIQKLITLLKYLFSIGPRRGYKREGRSETVVLQTGIRMLSNFKHCQSFRFVFGRKGDFTITLQEVVFGSRVNKRRNKWFLNERSKSKEEGKRRVVGILVSTHSSEERRSLQVSTRGTFYHQSFCVDPRKVSFYESRSLSLGNWYPWS